MESCPLSQCPNPATNSICRSEPAPYAGWFRPRRGRWRRLCGGDTQAACFLLLLARVPAESGDLIVLPADRQP